MNDVWECWCSVAVMTLAGSMAALLWIIRLHDRRIRLLEQLEGVERTSIMGMPNMHRVQWKAARGWRDNVRQAVRWWVRKRRR